MSNSSNQSSKSYNILSRPKRSIHFQKLTNDRLNNVENTSDDETDEDFNPDESPDNSDEVFNSNSSLSNKLNDSLSEFESDEKKNDGEKIKFVATNKKSYVKPIKANGELNKKKEKITNKLKTDNKIVKRRRKRKKKLVNNFNSDEETQKFINSFKTTNIIKKSKNKSKDTSKINTEVNTKNNGPYLKCLLTKNEYSMKNYPIYQICDDNINTQMNNGPININKNKNSFFKEKVLPIVDQTFPWICCLCHNKPNFINGLGGLFGPYRIGLNEQESSSKMDMKINDNFKEVWLHEGCAIWSPNINLRENCLEGISNVIDASNNLKCSKCKNYGATLICHTHGCNKAYHYPCAVLNGCEFNKENFTILCKNHNR